MIGNHQSIDLILPIGATANMTIEPNASATFSLQTSKNTEIEFTFSKEYEFQIIDIHVSGIAAGDSVTMEQTDTGIIVNGLNGISISVTDEDEHVTDETSAGVQDGRPVNIFVHPENNSVSTDFSVTETPADPSTENSTVCKFCKKIHGNSLWERIISFFHSIFYFFAHLFGKM